MFNKNIVLFSGSAKLPVDTASFKKYKYISLVVLIDMQSGEIVEVEYTVLTQLSRNFIASLLVGNSLMNGIGEIVNSISVYYQGDARKAIITSLRTIYAKYVVFHKNRKEAAS
ncbi:uncharacterized protein DUF3870 [Anaerospora hongkongensis]|uniref:Uncharacterized protein DUF3870 n=1 Tax=Anaerospora hongkongensis TaxID=244830 RepID=A0A4R1Q2W0_9FIRM|nr:DUF3870 domain-containing protein [Anaerospora hongkongensis]TCL38838.1 uncharacterized protein DUF3870 [Anaerospora hongkongensis]